MQCSRCGADIDTGSLLLIRDHEVAKTVQLLRGELDFLRCAAGDPTTIPAKVFYWASAERSMILSPGSPEIGTPDEVRELLRERLAQGWDGAEREDEQQEGEEWEGGSYLADSPDHFRDLVAALLRLRIKAVLPWITEADEGEFDARWRELTGAVYSALGVAAAGALPQVAVDPGNGVTGLAICQVRTWQNLCEAWAIRARGLPRTFEEDLRTYVDSSPPIGDALSRFSAAVARISRTGAKGEREWFYCARAVEAVLHHRAGLPNPAAFDWAVEYLRLELRLKKSWIGTSITERIRLGGHHVRPTVSAFELGRLIEVEKGIRISAFDKRPRRVSRRWNKTEERIHQAAVRAGHPNLAVRLAEQVVIRIPRNEFATTLAQMIDELGVNALSVIRAQIYAGLAHHGTDADFDLVHDALVRQIGPVNATALLGEALITARNAAGTLRLLERLRDVERPEDFRRSDLSDVRALALTLTGRTEEALAEIGDQDAWFTTERRLTALHPFPHKHEIATAVVLRECGRVDQALALLEEQWAKLRPSLRPYVAVELAPAYFTTGRFGDAVTLLRQALAHAVEFSSLITPVVRAQLQYALLRDQGESDEELWDLALHSLDISEQGQFTDSGTMPYNPVADLYAAMARLEVLRRGAPGAEPGTLDDLPRLRAQSATRGDCFVHLQTARAEALAEEIRGGTPDWAGLERLAAERYGVDPPVECFLRPAVTAVSAVAAGAVSAVDVSAAADPAATAFPSDTLQSALALVRKADRLVGRAMERFSDFEQAAGVEVAYPGDLREIQGALLAAAGPGGPVGTGELQRTVEELWRDPARRMLAPGGFADDRALTGFCDRTGLARTAVLEQVEHGPDRRSLVLTLIEAGHAPVTEVVMPLDNLGPLAARLGTRIANWTPSRPGDPLDVPQWRTFTSTLHAVLSQRLGADDHVVVIESPQLYRLPWHLALGPSWTCSYAPSWGSLMLRPDAPVARPAVGAVCAPRFGESRAVEAALTASLAASRAEAAAAELVFASADREHADAAALVRILESSDLCTLLCHGMVDTGSASVSLLLSSEGRRPPGDSLAAARSGLAAHRFDWRSATAVSRSPSAIFSAACSSGLNHPRGGQQVGLFSALRHRGLRTLVAPRWDILAEQVLPVLNRCRALVLSGSPPGVALRSSCLEAEQSGVPGWIAWSMALEGDW
ncbi:tetratricopeptide repeat protein [Streptomyces sp. NBC_00536]|uniref:tetratricopeptide repeat protein n=1 Tax=Streptomyces sp. NBC_00536 TaxID=2975769 RepID=UPI002E8165AE|nr:tetratricopeptide repeat protein [Streptomyces sp. NBC_00536]WUC76979.1 tetratricopeptide repeat protein [Streptomyces sp. NBC_00536]